MALDDAMDDGEAEAGAFADTFGGEERLEDPRSGRLVHAGAGPAPTVRAAIRRPSTPESAPGSAVEAQRAVIDHEQAERLVLLHPHGRRAEIEQRRGPPVLLDRRS